MHFFYVSCRISSVGWCILHIDLLVMLYTNGSFWLEHCVVPNGDISLWSKSCVLKIFIKINCILFNKNYSTISLKKIALIIFLFKKNFFLLFYFKCDIPHTGYSLATLGALYQHRVIQVNRLSQVLAHRDEFRSSRTAMPATV